MSTLRNHSSTPRTSLTSSEPALAPLNTLERLNLLDQALRDARISRPAVLCLLALDSHYNATVGVSWPSQIEIAQVVGSTREHVCSYLRELIQAGYIVVQRGRYGNRYRFLPPAPKQRPLVLVPDVSLPATSEPLPDVSLPDTSQVVAAPDVSLPDKSDVSPPVYVTGSIEQGVNRSTETTPERKRERAPMKPPAVKPHRLPADWVPPQELLDWAVNDLKIPRPVVDTQTANFQAYFWDNPKVCRPGWVKSFQTWMRNASKGGIRDAVTPWERAQRGGAKGNGVLGGNLNLNVPKTSMADFGHPGLK